MPNREECLRLASLARSFLMSARVYQQFKETEDLHAEMYSPVGLERLRLSARYGQLAQSARFTAKVAMITIEQLNGEAFLNGGTTYPLRYLIDGRNHKRWSEYEEVYQPGALGEWGDIWK